MQAWYRFSRFCNAAVVYHCFFFRFVNVSGTIYLMGHTLFFYRSFTTRRFVCFVVCLFVFVSAVFYTQRVYASTCFDALCLLVTVGHDQAALSWRASPAISFSVASYEYSVDGGDAWVRIPNPSSDEVATTHTVTGLTPGVSYTFTLRVRDPAGLLLTTSEEISLTTSEEISVIPGKITYGIDGLALSNNDHLGSSLTVSSDGNTLFVGAVDDDTGGSGRGAVHIFTKSEDVWAHSTTIAHNTHGLLLDNDDSFGHSVLLSSDGNTLFVGAVDDDTGGSGRGAVHIFTKSEDVWAHSTTIAHNTHGLLLDNDDSFGHSVLLSSDGNTLFVGAVDDDTGGSGRGAVHIFTKSEDVWAHNTTIAHDAEEFALSDNDHFGYSLAFSQNEEVLHVGSPGDDTGGSDRGAVHIFIKDTGLDVFIWRHFMALTDDTDGVSLEDEDNFGRSLAVSPDENTLFVGVASDGVNEGSDGNIYFFTRGPDIYDIGVDTWVYATKMTDNTPDLLLQNGDRFGYSIAVSPDGNTLFVGAIGNDTNGENDGAVYFFTKKGAVWVSDTTMGHGFSGLMLDDYDVFGHSVVLSPDGNTFFVGTPLSGKGVVYIFTRGDGRWLYHSKLADGVNGLTLRGDDFFGSSVAISSDGNILFVGAAGDDTGGRGRGAVHLFTKGSGGIWAHDEKFAHGRKKLVLNNLDYFGYSLALSSDGNILFVGARGNNVNGRVKNGAVHVFIKSDGLWKYGSKIEQGVNGLVLQDNEYFGHSAVLSPDGNTLFVGAPGSNFSGDGKGAVYLFSKGSADGVWQYRKKIADGTHGLVLGNNDSFGSSLAISPNGNTLFVGVIDDDTGGKIDSGAVHVFVKSGGAWSHTTKIAHNTHGLMLDGSDYFGSSLVSSSDGNTLYVGATRDDTGGEGRGAIHVFLKDGSAWVYSTTIAHRSGGLDLDLGDDFGHSAVLSPNGNVLFVGAPNDDTGGENRGAVYLFTKSEVDRIHIVKIAHNTHGFLLQNEDNFGSSLALSSDGNTLYVGTTGDNSGGSNRGAVYVLTKNEDSAWVYDSKMAHNTNTRSLSDDNNYGSAVALSPDGSTLYIGAAGDDINGEDEGAVDIFTKSESGDWGYDTWIAYGIGLLFSADGDNFGSAITLSPDGSTLFISAINDDTGGSDRGAVHVFAKNKRGNWTRTTKIAHNTHGLLLDDSDYFGSSLAIAPDGNTLFVGTVGDNAGSINLGVVHLFVKNGGVWSYSTTIEHGINRLALGDSDGFGSSVAISQDGNTLYVGNRYGDAHGRDGGIVHILTSVEGVWWAYAGG